MNSSLQTTFTNSRSISISPIVFEIILLKFMLAALASIGFIINRLFLILIFDHNIFYFTSDRHIANLSNLCFAGGTFVLAVLHPFGDAWTAVLVLAVVK